MIISGSNYCQPYAPTIRGMTKEDWYVVIPQIWSYRPRRLAWLSWSQQSVLSYMHSGPSVWQLSCVADCCLCLEWQSHRCLLPVDLQDTTKDRRRVQRGSLWIVATSVFFFFKLTDVIFSQFRTQWGYALFRNLIYDDCLKIPNAIGVI